MCGLWRVAWLWLTASWLLAWLTEAVMQPGDLAASPSSTSLCDLGACLCTRGKLLCDCSTSSVKEIVLKNLNEGNYGSISVTNCGHLHVTSQALAGLLALQQLSVANVTQLTLEEQSFSWFTTDHHLHSGLIINISDTYIPEIPSYCFRGHLRDISLTNVNVSRVRAYAFSSMDHAERLEFTRVNFTDLETQSFKKFSVDYITIKDCVFTTLPSRTMVDVEVHQEVKFDNLKVDTVKFSGLRIHGPRHFRLSKSTLNHLEHQAFHVHSRGSVSIMDNVFPHIEKSAFSGFTVEKRYMNEYGKQELTFENNTIVDFENSPLVFNTTGFSPRLDWILINQKCSCQSADYWTTELVYFSSDPLMVTPAPHVGTVMYCQNTKTTMNVGDYQRLFCSNVPQSGVLLTLAFISGTVVSLSVLIMFIYCGFKERAKRYINVPNSPSPLKQNKNHILVIPDGKTYRETELHVIVEHAEPILPSEYAPAPDDAPPKT